MKPFSNEPILELRRAPIRAQLQGALEAFDAEPVIQVPVWVGEDTRSGGALIVDRPGRARADRGRVRDRDRRRRRPGARAGRGQRLAAALRRRARRGADPRRRVAARAAARDRGARGPRDRQAVARGRRRRLRGDRLPRVLRARGDRARAASGRRRRADPAARASATSCAGRRAASSRSSRPGTSRSRSRSGWSRAGLATGNAVVLKPAEQAPACAYMLVRALRESGVPPSALALLPGEGPVGAALVERPARAHDRVHRLRAGRAGDRRAAPRSSPPASGISSASWPRWAARTA